MDELYIETKNGTMLIEENIVKKYHLIKGTFSPFTGSRILGKDGDFEREDPPTKKPDLKQKDDEIDEMENGLMLSTSEMLDIAEGVDSNP